MGMVTMGEFVATKEEIKQMMDEKGLEWDLHQVNGLMPDGTFSDTSSTIKVTKFDERGNSLEGTIIVLMKPKRFKSRAIIPEPNSDKLRVHFNFSEAIFF